MNASENPKGTSLLVALARVLWMMIGPIALVMLAFNIALRGGGWFTPMDIAYIAILAAVLGARLLEFQSGAATTTDGRTLSPAALGRYLVVMIAIGAGAWIAANFIGNDLLGR